MYLLIFILLTKKLQFKIICLQTFIIFFNIILNLILQFNYITSNIFKNIGLGVGKLTKLINLDLY